MKLVPNSWRIKIAKLWWTTCNHLDSHGMGLSASVRHHLLWHWALKGLECSQSARKAARTARREQRGLWAFGTLFETFWHSNTARRSTWNAKSFRLCTLASGHVRADRNRIRMGGLDSTHISTISQARFPLTSFSCLSLDLLRLVLRRLLSWCRISAALHLSQCSVGCGP